MDTNGSSTDFNALSRLGAVDSGECDALADVFLGSSPAEQTGEPESDSIESAWSDRQEPVEPRVLNLVVGSHLNNPDDLFTRLCESQSVDPDRAVGCIQYGPAGWSARLIGRAHCFNGHRASVAHAISQVSEISDRVNVLLPPHHEVGELIKGLDNLSDPPDAIIVLATSIESDVVSAYRQLKSIASFCPEQLARCEVVMIATPDEEAEAALSRLLETADRFLNAPLTGRIIVESGDVESGDDEVSMDDDSETEAPMPGDSASESGPETLVQTQESIPEPVLEVADEPIHEPTDEPIDEPTPVPAPAFADSGDDDDNTLLSRLTQSMDRLDVRSPDAPRVILAIDQNGQVHAFASMIETDGLEPEPNALEALGRACAFIARHMPLLVQMDPRVSANAPPPAGHLVSDHFSQLDPCLGSDLHLHLAVPVRVAGRTIWGVSELRTD